MSYHKFIYAYFFYKLNIIVKKYNKFINYAMKILQNSLYCNGVRIRGYLLGH